MADWSPSSQDSNQDERAVRSMFDSVADEHGRITRERMMALMDSIGHICNDRQKMGIINAVHNYGKGFMEYGDFLEMVSSVKTKVQEMDLTEEVIFKALDKQGQGSLTLDNLRSIFPNLSTEETEKMFEIGDLNKDGRIDREEFSKLMAQMPSEVFGIASPLAVPCSSKASSSKDVKKK